MCIRDRYITSGKLQEGKRPTSGCCAEKLNLSTAYFDDLLRFETGKTLAEYFQFKCLYLSLIHIFSLQIYHYSLIFVTYFRQNFSELVMGYERSEMCIRDRKSAGLYCLCACSGARMRDNNSSSVMSWKGGISNNVWKMCIRDSLSC